MMMRRSTTTAFHHLLLFIIFPGPTLILAQESQPTFDQENPSVIFNDSSVLVSDSFLDESSHKCQPLKIPFCAKVDYNTSYPNFLGHKTQADAESEIEIYHHVAECSPNFRLFICATYAPVCFDHDNSDELRLFPCQSLCESVKQGCASILRAMGTAWPAALQCDKFPSGIGKGSELCVGNDSHSSIETYEKEVGSGVRMDPGFVCPKNFEVNSYKLYFNGKTYNNCALPCDDVYLNTTATGYVRLATGLFALICIVSSLFSYITFLIDTKRFQYPARPIVMIAFCQLVVAICYSIGFFTDNTIACNDPVEPPASLPNLKMIRTMTMGNKKGSCTLLFMTMYFFQVSSVFWWLMMTISWYMIAKLKWGPESVSGLARYFHFLSWTIPALLTLYASVLGDIEGDSLTGTCFLSTSNQESIRYLLIVPIVICMVLGLIFLTMGFKSIWDSKERLKLEYGSQISEHYKIVIRIGLYSLLFIVTSTIFIASHNHEQSNQTIWKYSWLSNICKNRDYSIPCPPRNYSNQGPHLSVFIIKHFSAMSMGLVSLGFMISEKTMKSYREIAELKNYMFCSRA